MSTDPFPAHVLPGAFGTYTVELARATQTPVDLVGIMVLGNLAAAAGGQVQVQARPGWVEPVNLFTVAVARPGERKSAIVSATTRPLHDYERQLADRRRPAIVEARVQRSAAEKAAEKAERAAGSAAAFDRDALIAEAISAALAVDAVQVPAEPRLLVDDATPEALATLMAAQGGAVAIISAEGGVFDLAAGRYSTKANLDVYLKGHAGDPLRVDRQTREALRIDRPALTVAIAVQPDVMRAAADQPGFRGRGLLGRFLYVVPDSTVGRRQIAPDPVPTAAEDGYRTDLIALARTLRERPVSTEPDTLTLTAAASDALQTFEAELEPRLAEDGDLGHVTDWAAKLAGAAVRIAALLHLAGRLRSGWSQPVDSDAIEGALAIARYLIPQALRAFDLMEAGDPTTAAARRVLRWIVTAGRDRFTQRDAHRGLQRAFPRAEDLEAPLDLLAEHGYIRRQQAVHDGPGRPPQPRLRGQPPHPEGAQPMTHPSSRGPLGGHPTVALQMPAALQHQCRQTRTRVNVDEGIASLIEALWQAGVPTLFSCQGGPTIDGTVRLAYIDLDPGAAPVVWHAARAARVHAALSFVGLWMDRVLACRMEFDLRDSDTLASAVRQELAETEGDA